MPKASSRDRGAGRNIPAELTGKICLDAFLRLGLGSIYLCNSVPGVILRPMLKEPVALQIIRGTLEAIATR